MRKTPWLLAEPYRLQPPGYESQYGNSYGAFGIPFPRTAVTLRCIVQDGENARADCGDDFAWDHVSVSLPKRIPNWQEMSFIKDIFWGEDECVLQFHVPATEHINLHPHTLHLWKPLLLPIPLPPASMV